MNLWKLYFSSLLLIFTPLSSLASENVSERVIKYDVRYVEKGGSPCLNVLFATYTDEQGQSLITFPAEGELELKFLFLKDTFDSSKEATLYRRLEERKRPTFKVNIFPNKKFYANYRLCVKNAKESPSLPVIKEKFFASALSSILATPLTNTVDQWEIYLRLLDMPENFKFITSFSEDADKREFSLKKTIPHFKRDVLVGGEALDIKKIMIQSTPVRVVSKNRIDQKFLTLYLERIIKKHRAFWRDNNFRNYLIVLLKNPLEQDCFSYVEGRHFFNAFFIQTPYCQGKYPSRFSWILSHELFHAWLGGKMNGLPEDLKSLDWFMEGFTDYYGLLLAMESGLINYSEYIKIYNDLIRDYYYAPLGDPSNQEISENDGKILYRWLPRLRGHFLARELAWQLSRDNLTSLDQIVRKIYKRSYTMGEPLIKKDIIDKVFSESLSEKLQDYVNRKIEKGEPFVFTEKALGPFATLVNREVDIPDLGFDLKAFFESQVIKELKENSPAFKAGLREGQKVLGSNIALPHLEKETLIEVAEEEKKIQIRFQHEIVKKIIPQYVHRSSFLHDH